MGLAEHVYSPIASVNFRLASVKLAFIFLSFTFFVCVYGVSHLVGSLTSVYRKLKTKEKIFWNLAVVRAVYGIFCGIVGTWAFFVDEELEKDVIFGTNSTSYVAMTTTVGFFVFECLAVSLSDIVYKKFSFLLNLHHWISLVGFSILMVVESSHFFGTRGLLLEISTPFSAVCWIFLKVGKADTLFWKANQFVLVHTFHLRSVIECSIWYYTYKHWDKVWDTMPLSLFIFLYTQLVLVTFIMTPYWTYKKTVQLINPVDWNFEDEQNKNKVKQT